MLLFLGDLPSSFLRGPVVTGNTLLFFLSRDVGPFRLIIKKMTRKPGNLCVSKNRSVVGTLYPTTGVKCLPDRLYVFSTLLLSAQGVVSLQT